MTEEMFLTYEDFTEEQEDKSDFLNDNHIHTQESNSRCTADHGSNDNLSGSFNLTQIDEHRHCKECREHIEGNGIICKNCGKINLWI